MAERRAANIQVLEGMGGTLPGAARPLLRSVQTPTLLPAPLLKDCVRFMFASRPSNSPLRHKLTE